MQHDIIEIRMTAYDHLSAHRIALRTVETLIKTATTARDRSMYQVMKLNAERNIAHWQNEVEKIHQEAR